MAKEKVKHLSGVLASVFAHAGHITKDDAKEISGLLIMNLKKHMIKPLTSLKMSCSMKAKKWINSWSILPKRSIIIWSIMAGSCSSRCLLHRGSERMMFPRFRFASDGIADRCQRRRLEKRPL